jgi:nucleoid-associated protein
MDIRNIIVHEVDKYKSETSGGTFVKVNPREETNPIDEHSINLVSQLSKLFRNTGLSSGNFKQPMDDNDDITDFEKLLKKNYLGQDFPDFVGFTKAAARNFSELLENAGNAKGGYLWFNHYVYDEKTFLSVVLLRKKAALRIKDLSLDPIEEIDLEKLHMAARINLSDWETNDPLKTRYISFRVGRATGNVTDYFSDFIGCQEYTVAKEDTANLIDITASYCKHHKLSKDQTEVAKNEVHDKCRTWIADDKPVYLSNLSVLLDKVFSKEEDDSGVFLSIAQNEPYCLNEEVKIDKGVLGNLVRYRGHNSKMNISFDSNLLDETVIFHKKTGRLEFIEIPEKLLAQLKSRTPD